MSAIGAPSPEVVRGRADHGTPGSMGCNHAVAPLPSRSMGRRLILGALAAAASVLVLATPVLAHGDHDARPLARDLKAGPFIVSLWQVYSDAGTAMTPHLIVMFDGAASAPPAADVVVTVNAQPMEIRLSTTTSNGLETTAGVAEGDVVTVTVSDGSEAWALEPVVVPPPPTSMLPMPELIYTSIFLTAGTAFWVGGRTARAWRKPAVSAT